MGIYNNNIRDNAFKATTALTAADGSVTSADFDLRAPLDGSEDFEMLISIPELSATELASADTLIITVQAGDSAAPTTAVHTFPTITGDGDVVPAQEIRTRLPSTIGRYVNVKFTTAGTSGDMSAKDALVELLF